MSNQAHAHLFNLNFFPQTKNHDLLYIWLTKLSAKRWYKKNEAMYIHQGILQALSAGNSSSLPAMASLAQRNRAMMDMVRGIHNIRSPKYRRVELL